MIQVDLLDLLHDQEGTQNLLWQTLFCSLFVFIQNLIPPLKEDKAGFAIYQKEEKKDGKKKKKKKKNTITCSIGSQTF